MSLWSPKTKKPHIFLVCAQWLPTKTINYIVFFWFLGSMSSKNQTNSRKTKENQKNLEKTKKPKNQRLCWFWKTALVFWFSRGFFGFLWFSSSCFCFLSSWSPKTKKAQCILWFWWVTTVHKPKKHMCFFVFGHHKLKKPKKTRGKPKKTKKTSRKPKNQSSLPKPAQVFVFFFGFLVFWFSRGFCWFSLVSSSFFVFFWFVVCWSVYLKRRCPWTQYSSALGSFRSPACSVRSLWLIEQTTPQQVRELQLFVASRLFQA